MRRVVAFALLLLPVPAAAQDAGDVARGARIAREACSGCHAERGPAKPGAAPSFQEIARTPSITMLAIKVFLKSPHADMPNIMLAEDEIDALAAYVVDQR
jgi:mono/diheme cytochrome c family protein